MVTFGDGPEIFQQVQPSYQQGGLKQPSSLDAAAFQRDSGGYYQDYDDENHSGLGSVRGLFIGLGSYGVFSMKCPRDRPRKHGARIGPVERI